MQQQELIQQYDYEEISLRELIEILLKGWKLIAIITAICVLMSGVFSFLIIKPTYEAKSVLMASLATDKLANISKNGESVEAILSTISTYPVLTIQTYKEQIKSPKVLQQVIEELSLTEKEITRVGLRDMISLEAIKDTNLIEIKVTHNDPKLAADIANAVAKRFTEFVTDISREQASKSSKFLKTQIESEKQKLDEASLELKKLMAQPRGVDELVSEQEAKLILLSEYKVGVVEKEVELSKLKAGLTAAEEELKDTPKILVTNKSVSEDQLLSSIISEEKNKSAIETASITMKNEEININYFELSTKVAEYKMMVSEVSEELEMMKAKIDETQKEIEAIQSDLAEKKHQLNLVQRNVDIAQATYDAFLKKYEETRVVEATEMGESTINIVSHALVPIRPVAPRKMLNVAIAGILGVMVGIFVAFFKEYWQKSAVQL
ncbi:GNVR domain-containing protein [Proteiniborus sp. MB09-C3]|uniref:GumC family protein n=1 Tax=Proteiniborus sp. MB09-C3 TaxID=3050072 RepID=UPI0025573EB2|nr:GNVR domain-containing protein [Proteiniborus sp. MB09-C3]WIV12110.1 GNVR domain-containing protein [Proteiniborus sp. MB09-C3]